MISHVQFLYAFINGQLNLTLKIYIKELSRKKNKNSVNHNVLIQTIIM